ncbi:MAG: hypothetical protein JXQ71_11070 [Verrucomicrobia bacterium]|nr:hypothetical protein [Verrucomicrobiota bacterium]
MPDVTKWSRDLEAGIRKIVSRLHSIAPSVVGLPVADAEARLKEAEDEILQQLDDIKLRA